ncbi:MAG: hypothetical protein R2711_12095 [Acidimicrobiales bacterium]
MPRSRGGGHEWTNVVLACLLQLPQGRPAARRGSAGRPAPAAPRPRGRGW